MNVRGGKSETGAMPPKGWRRLVTDARIILALATLLAGAGGFLVRGGMQVEHARNQAREDSMSNVRAHLNFETRIMAAETSVHDNATQIRAIRTSIDSLVLVTCLTYAELRGRGWSSCTTPRREP